MESLHHTLVDGETPRRPHAPSFLDPKSEPASDMDQGSTRAPSTSADGTSEKKEIIVTKSDYDEKSELPLKEGVPDHGVAEEEYPTGARLFFIVVALVLSIFLVALDMVSNSRPQLPFQDSAGYF